MWAYVQKTGMRKIITLYHEGSNVSWSFWNEKVHVTQNVRVFTLSEQLFPISLTDDDEMNFFTLIDGEIIQMSIAEKHMQCYWEVWLKAAKIQ